MGGTDRLGQESGQWGNRSDLHRSHVEILRTLWTMADKNGRVQVTNHDLQKITALGRRTVQMRTRELARGGWIEKRFVRRTRRFNDANVYVVKRSVDDPRQALARGRKKFASRGRNGCTHLNNTKPYIKPDTLPVTSTPKCNLPAKQPEAKRSAPSQRSMPVEGPPVPQGATFYRPARRPNLSPEQLLVLLQALALLDIPETRNLPETRDSGKILDRIDRLRERYIPGYNAGYWNGMVKRHGHLAFCAVVETVAMVLKRIPRAEGDDIRSPAAYLGGIFRKSTEGLKMRPDLTLESWIEIEQRACREAEDRVKVRAVAKRRDERDKLFRVFIAEASKIADYRVVDQYFQHLVLHKRTGNGVCLKAPSRYIRDLVRTEHMTELCAAWSEACEQSVFVKVE